MKMSYFYVALRFFAAGIKFLSILCLPFIFNTSGVAFIAIILGAERFLSFLTSMENHAYFNRRLILKNHSAESVNNAHFPILFYGAFFALIACYVINYFFQISQDVIPSFFFNLYIISVFSAFHNEIGRRAQSMNDIPSFSIILALKNSTFGLALLFTAILESSDPSVFLNLFALVSVLSFLLCAFAFKKISIFSIKKVYFKSLNRKYILASFKITRKFFLQGVCIFAIPLIERIIIGLNYETIILAHHFMLQSLAIYTLVIWDPLHWGPNYANYISRFEVEKSGLLEVYLRFFQKTYVFTLIVVVVFISLLFITSSISDDWSYILSEYPFWVLINAILIFIIPFDSLTIYFLHAKRLDLINAIFSLAGLTAMILFLFINTNYNFLPFGLVIAYLISLSGKFIAYTYILKK